MSRAFRYLPGCGQRLRAWGNHAPHASGSSVGGPWALGPKRLQWLTNITAGFEIAAFPRLTVVRRLSHIAVMPAQAGIPLSLVKTGRKLGPGFRRGDGKFDSLQSNLRQSRALAQISFSRILIGPEASAETSPPFHFQLSRGPPRESALIPASRTPDQVRGRLFSPCLRHGRRR